MTAARTLKTVAGATALLKRYAEVDGKLAAIEAGRIAALAAANASADGQATPLLAELEKISARLQPWWNEAGRKIAAERKSIELGGCMIGSRMGKPKLAHDFDDDDKAVEALRATRFGNQTTKTKYSLDRAATLKQLQLGGKASEAIARLGFRIDQGETFFINRVEQPGTITAVTP